ncbi:aspartyl-phosphate phosphatase Spo0E family protein [Neobacillus niacini]|uniref:aspartyl-phosphate phosphatase Spo0E family protein n=1 Tax=Neobacillus niacini TaxID=86668 RepID=UPI0028632EB7|nr:aspartyl-phosphate phosphatase Spo0E family protein [Neobacillus niacini]MDR7002325.1 stage 0 sporulation regulatory protein [Neobacillus niacini]
MYEHGSSCSDMLAEIKVKREHMMDCANKKGFTCEETIKYSQELDELIYEYQKAASQTSNKQEEVKTSFKQTILLVWPKVIAGF